MWLFCLGLPGGHTVCEAVLIGKDPGKLVIYKLILSFSLEK